MKHNQLLPHKKWSPMGTVQPTVEYITLSWNILQLGWLQYSKALKAKISFQSLIIFEGSGFSYILCTLTILLGYGPLKCGPTTGNSSNSSEYDEMICHGSFLLLSFCGPNSYYKLLKSGPQALFQFLLSINTLIPPLVISNLFH